ncbi:electron transfer flavoprotein subunit alpha/FixB family protein [Corynebacterium sp. sy017]|uniref:electron transfer flavoprotein subunit alpha/FixB family protein n=1 Tax=unclassified Corynebacterium TaxID=2624378 RepID=UPI00118715B3|nr:MULTISPECIES: electron transfer flavoprotein subunit alpha/FixB family protein [unclassified Corynebacterium]MBP3089030.1 electron transfer flavoprotein subunit alpha/FixB family protein [Corynebacterium sp. sy017]QDZ42396.1 electron transfer flavoprotein subunit alpha/FixB family protein [Corynebacterium sp. sy039]TSD91351.1 electron transfer flavoprotein subunit alpha/FixB family protein [Corynebacterium sp. SY003]
MSFAYVLVEQHNGALAPTTAELISQAKVFGSVSAVVLGNATIAPELVAELGALGADSVMGAIVPDLDSRLIVPQVNALHALAAQTPAPIILSAGADTNEIAGRLAARLASGVLFDVVAINADRSASMSIFGDTIAVSAAVGGNSPIYTLRPGTQDLAATTVAAGAAVYNEFELPPAQNTEVTVKSYTPAVHGDRPELTQAKVVVAGGRGMDSAENFGAIVEPLADVLGGAVGATRDAVDLGYYPATFQVGQTGVSVSPDLYIGLGISGAIQHTSGMQTAKKIIVINNDEEAPFFAIADLGVVGDAQEIAPLLTEELAKRKG